MAKAMYTSSKDIDEKLLLGYMYFYNLGDVRISEDDLYNLFVKSNVDLKYLKKINPVDAFRRATSKSKTKIDINYAGQSKQAIINVDEVASDNNCVIRAVGRKVVNEKKQDLDYIQVGKIAYVRATAEVELLPANEPWKTAGEFNYDNIMVEMVSKYRDWSKNHTRDTIRNQINGILKDMNPTPILDTGYAKFIPKANKNNLYALKDLILDLSMYTTEGNLFEIIPIIDTQEQREIIYRAATKDIKEEMNLFVNELKDIIKEKQAISGRQAATYIERFKDLKEKASVYEDLLEMYMTTLNNQITKAMDFVKANTEE